jgi:sugar transferase (PEP-CTERM system associated)
MFVQPIAVIGTGIFAQEILDAIDKNKDSGFKIVVFVGDPNPSIIQKNLAVIDNIKDLRDYCLNRVIGKIVVALDEKRGIPLYELIQYKFLGIEIVDGARFYEEVVGRIPVHRINPSWLVFSDGFHVSRLKKLFKRILDISAAMSGILVFFPVFLLTAFLIKLESAGGIFYFQNRVGENGKIFKIIKFRSMRKDAEINGPIWAAENDSRVTKIGRFIRKTRIDELPQLINVLRGDMSLVGPRPERPEFIENLAKDIPFYNNRHVVKPGITGWAQIYYSYGSSIDDALHKLEYDFYYIKNLSIVIDLMIIFQTIKVVLFGKGAR